MLLQLIDDQYRGTAGRRQHADARAQGACSARMHQDREQFKLLNRLGANHIVVLQQSLQCLVVVDHCTRMGGRNLRRSDGPPPL